jgi:protease-4
MVRRRTLMSLLPVKWMSLLVLALTGCGTPSFLITPVSSSSTLEETVVQPGQGFFPDKIAVIEVEGMLANVKSGGLLQPTENVVSKFAQQMDTAEHDSKVKAVVLRINSPGGTVTSSDTMYQIVRRFREKSHKPVVASGQEVVASGAYYTACASDEIVVQPTTVIGSIGVIFETMQFKGTLDKLGITTKSIKSGSLKDIGSPFKALRSDEEQVMQEMVDEYFARFVGIVRDRRPVKETPAPALSDYAKETYAGIYSGRVFSGNKAVEMGLADRTGLLDDAIDRARTLAHAEGAMAIMYRRPYAYGGSIYASSSTPIPHADVMKIELPEAVTPLPAGFYYLWRPGL